jgi:hypothetical protein
VYGVSSFHELLAVFVNTHTPRKVPTGNPNNQKNAMILETIRP